MDPYAEAIAQVEEFQAVMRECIAKMGVTQEELDAMPRSFQPAPHRTKG